METDPKLTPGSDPAQAAALLLERHGRRIYTLGLRMCGDVSEAEDLVQDVFMQAFRRWPTFRGTAKASTWLYTIAARACKRRRAKRSKRGRVVRSFSELMPWSESTVMELVTADGGGGAGSGSGAGGGETQAERNEALETVRAEIARLPEHFRAPLVLKEVLEMSVQDVAEVLGLKVDTVKTRVHRARLALRKAMTRAAEKAGAPAPIYERQVCLDLLKAKLASMDRGRGKTIPAAELCARCRAVFRELDLVQDACADLTKGDLPAALRAGILRALAEREAAAAEPGSKKRGRKPVGAS